MPSSLRHPKTLAEWLELDYFHRPRLIRRLWWWLVPAALLISAAFAAWTVFAGNQKVFEAGPVSQAHAMLQCAQCHTQGFQTAVRLLHSDPDYRSVPDSACQVCHSGAIHHETAIEDRRCASCHREHHGRPALVRVADQHCTSCHADLHLKEDKPSEPQIDPHISAFAPDKHPDYRLFRKGDPVDPGQLYFNHQVHLNPEGVLVLDETQVKKVQQQAQKQGGRNFLDLPREMKARRKLECQDCHQRDKAGRYMQPIRYEAHCQKCHPLSVQLIGDWTNAALAASARRFSDVPAIHPSSSKQVEEVRGGLRDRLTRFIQAPANAGFLKVAEPPPERLDFGTRWFEPLPRERYAWVNAQQAQLERLLFDGAGGCRYCHVPKGTVSDGLPDFLPTGIPQRWNQHAEFKHHSHRMLDCAECHPKAQTSTKTADVLLPRIDTCCACHEAGKDKARSDCVECHKYHNPNEQRKFRGPLTIQQALGR